MRCERAFSSKKMQFPAWQTVGKGEHFAQQLLAVFLQCFDSISQTCLWHCFKSCLKRSIQSLLTRNSTTSKIHKNPFQVLSFHGFSVAIYPWSLIALWSADSARSGATFQSVASSFKRQRDRDVVGTHLGVSINGGTPKWMVYLLENPIKVDDLGVAPFMETRTSLEASKYTGVTVPMLNFGSPQHELRHL